MAKRALFNSKPFADNSEYLKNYVDLIYIKAVVGTMISFAEQTSFRDLLNLNRQNANTYDEFGASSRNEFIDKLKMMKQHLRAHEGAFKARLANSNTEEFFLEKLGREYKLSRIEITIIAAAYAITNTSRFEHLGRNHSFHSSSCNEVHDFLIMLAHSPQQRLPLKPHFGPGSKIVQNSIISLSGRATSESDFLRQDIEISRRICAQIQGMTTPDDAILAFAQLLDPEVDLKRVVYDEQRKSELLNLIKNHKVFIERRKGWNMDKLVSYGFGTTILFSGEPGTGKTLMANALAKEAGIKLMQIDVPSLFKERNFEENFKTVMLEASLQEDVLVFFDEADELFGDRNMNNHMTMILKEFEQFSGVCILATNRKQLLDEAMDRRILVKVDFELPDADARKDIWQQHLPKELPLADDVNLDELARKFNFAGGYIKNAVILACHNLSITLENDGKIHQADLVAAAKNQRSSQLERMSERIIPNTKLEDVILEPEQQQAVMAIIAEYRNKGKVFSRWGFKTITPYGCGTVALFHGPSGSGKTMTAEAIATELGINLVNVSANHLISKYAGESAQSIHRLFAKAKAEDAMILFDECESLFAARNDGQGSNSALSRDNNQQTTVLLREIERFDGIVVLTSNHVVGDSIDKAFARRIRHHIAFTAPNKNLRTKIWQKHFPSEAPLSKSIDWNNLADAYDFAGGTIKQISLKAAFQAAETNSEITHSIIESLCEFELGNNMVGYKKKVIPVGF